MRGQRRRSREGRECGCDIVSRATDGIVDVVDASVNEFERTYDRTRERIAETEERIAETEARRSRRGGVPEEDDLPIRNFESLTAEVIVDHVDRLNKLEDLRMVLAYEGAHKNRKTVVAATQARIDQLNAPPEPTSG
jgi:hypothetical protein